MVLLLKHKRFHFSTMRDVRLRTVRQFRRLMDEQSTRGEPDHEVIVEDEETDQRR